MVSSCNPHFRVTATAGFVKQRRNEIYGELSNYKCHNQSNSIQRCDWQKKTPHHYNTAHPNCQVDINVDIQRNTLKQKLSEALYISRSKPSLNDKSELESIVKYL